MFPNFDDFYFYFFFLLLLWSGVAYPCRSSILQYKQVRRRGSRCRFIKIQEMRIRRRPCSLQHGSFYVHSPAAHLELGKTPAAAAAAPGAPHPVAATAAAGSPAFANVGKCGQCGLTKAGGEIDQGSGTYLGVMRVFLKVRQG